MWFLLSITYCCNKDGQIPNPIYCSLLSLWHWLTYQYSVKPTASFRKAQVLTGINPSKRCAFSEGQMKLTARLTSVLDLSSPLKPSSIRLIVSFALSTNLYLPLFLLPPLPTPSLLSYPPLLISSNLQTLCLSTAPITLPRMHQCTISK